jgi:predicted XRE-type DNA-binding protein
MMRLVGASGVHDVQGKSDMGSEIGTKIHDRDEFRLKSRLANKVALVAQDRGLGVSEVASACSLPRDAVEAILEGLVHEIPLYTIMKALMALGMDIEIKTGPSEMDQGEIFLELQDA